MARKKSVSVEQDLSELEQIVERMEQGELPLEESLRLFKQGIDLTQRCRKALEDAEQKVRILISQNDEQDTAQIQTFDPLESQ